MPKKDNTTLLLVGAAAVIGYFLFRQGGTLNKTSASGLPAPMSLLTPPPAGLQKIPGISDELPSLPDIGIIAPALDPTGMQITMY